MDVTHDKMDNTRSDIPIDTHHMIQYKIIQLWNAEVPFDNKLIVIYRMSHDDVTCRKLSRIEMAYVVSIVVHCVCRATHISFYNIRHDI